MNDLLPCATRQRLYDTALFEDVPEADRAAARVAAAPLCAVCPAPCAQPVNDHTPAPSSGARPARRTARCGTRSGYSRHRRNGEPACDACQAANRATSSRYYLAFPNRPLGPVNHGTPGGCRQHWYRRETPCPACRAAFNDAQNARRRAARSGAAA